MSLFVILEAKTAFFNTFLKRLNQKLYQILLMYQTNLNFEDVSLLQRVND